jgi:hypothetical protein
MSEIDAVFLNLDTKLKRFKREFGSEFTQRVAAKTPVKTGALQGGWGFEMHAEDIEVYNTKDYASHVEFGTPHMAPRGMLRRTLLEVDQIAEVAAKKAGLKK